MRKYTESLLEAFLTSKTIKEVEEKTGLSRTTIYKYKADADFQSELARRRLETVRSAIGKLQNGLNDVTDVVISIATNEEVQPQIRLNAAQIILSQCRSWMETIDFAERLEKLEKAMDDKGFT